MTWRAAGAWWSGAGARRRERGQASCLRDYPGIRWLPVERGLLCSISPDARDAEGLLHHRPGVEIAWKFWLTKENVVNTKPLVVLKMW